MIKPVKTTVMITIDTETFPYKRKLQPLETMVYGRVGGGSFGIERIMSLCDRRGFKATFFVDALEHYFFGKPAVRQICRCITERCHDVQLHAHPIAFPGSQEDHLSRFTLDEQVRMVREGAVLIEEGTGSYPVAFRAGEYAANLDTIKALETNGILIDSSYFYLHRYCTLAHQLGNRYRNNIFRIGGVTEIPVTVYPLISRHIAYGYSKLDLNACSAEEICYVIGKMQGVSEVIILFLHSFSLVKRDQRTGALEPDLAVQRKFEKVLDFVSRHSCLEVKTVADFHRENASGGLPAAEKRDYVAASNLPLTFGRFADRWMR